MADDKRTYVAAIISETISGIPAHLSSWFLGPSSRTRYDNSYLYFVSITNFLRLYSHRIVRFFGRAMSVDLKYIQPILNVWWDTEFWSHAAIGLERPVAVNRTTGRANDRTIAELLVGSCISGRRSCNQSAQVVRRCMFSHSEVLRDVARPIVRG